MRNIITFIFSFLILPNMRPPALWAADECPNFGGSWQGACSHDDGNVFHHFLDIGGGGAVDCSGIRIYGEPFKSTATDYGTGVEFYKNGTFAGQQHFDETVTSGWIEGNTKFYIDRLQLTRDANGSMESGTRERTISVMGFGATQRHLTVDTVLYGESEGPNPKKWQRKKSCRYTALKSPNK